MMFQNFDIFIKKVTERKRDSFDEVFALQKKSYHTKN